MPEKLSPLDLAVLRYLAVVRGARAIAAATFLSSSFTCSEEAMRKRLERLAKKGLVVAMAMASGQQLYRLTKNGVKLTGAPSSYSDSPTIGVLYEMIATSNCACNPKNFHFLTRQDFMGMMRERDPAFACEDYPGRFTFHLLPAETRLAFWLAEFRPAEQLAARVATIAENVQKTSPLFRELVELNFFEVAIAVPSDGVAHTLKQNQYAVPIAPVVIPQLLEFAAMQIA